MYLLLLLVLVWVPRAIADDSSFEARKARARDLLEQRDYEEALGVARSIHREWMDDVITYQLMAEANLGLGNYAAAESDIQWMLDLREGKADARGWWLVAQFREVTGDLEGAIEAIATGCRPFTFPQGDRCTEGGLLCRPFVCGARTARAGDLHLDRTGEAIR